MPEGRIVVHWSCAAVQAFRLAWREEGGPAPEPNVGTGFGSTILDRIVGEYLAADPSCGWNRLARYSRSRGNSVPDRVR
ncbi:hypothetical protein [uncultured Jannaschia sp.]|uniref:hypothetical protein n=1 Tax=uncultured Jannaschia sp. TaxID=293347 RepID=UPI00261A01D1|nr:hypothetical protein [uncultured Jannaschia sp.]